MFYVFHGDDELSQKETLADLKRKLGDPAMLDLNTTRFEGQGWSLGALRHACDSLPFLSEGRLVIVEGFFAGTPPPAAVDELLAYLPHLPETTRLVFLESRTLPGKHPLLALAQGDSGFARAFPRPEGNALERWVRQRVEKLGGRIAPRAAYSLAANVGNDLRLLNSEIEKLVLYKDEGEIIEEADVALLSPYAAEASVFDLVDAVGGRQGRDAARLLHQKYAAGADPFFLFSMLVRQFRLLLQVKELAQQGHDAAAVAKMLRLHNFVAAKLVQQSHSFSLEQLEQIYAHLLEIDVAVKTGRSDMGTALDLLVAGLAGETA